MEKAELLSAILDNLKESVIFVDNDHIIRYMNSAAKKHYARFGEVIGKSLFDCHKPGSAQKIKDIYVQLKNGAEEVLYASNEKHRVYMRSMRDPEGNLLGYTERFEPPVK